MSGKSKDKWLRVVGPCEMAMLETLADTTLFAFFALALRRRFKR